MRKHTLSSILLSLFLLMTGCAAPVPRSLPVLEPVDGEVAAAAALAQEGNVKRSPYYVSPDYFSGNVSKTLHLLKRFQTYQQTSERSCGAACTLMTLAWFGETVSEDDLDEEMDIRYFDNPRADGSYGASTQAIADAFADRGYQVTSSADTQDADGCSFPDEASFADYVVKHIDNRQPILTESVEWGGHWMVLIGYDDMGTPGYEDDVLVFADPYDTTDHHQDGYLTESFERFFFTWFDHGVMKEGERVQQYVAVSKPAA